MIGIADAHTLHGNDSAARYSSVDLENAMTRTIDEYSRALVFQLLVFEHADNTSMTYPPGTLTVPPEDRSRSTTLKTTMCDISAKMLSEMVLFARSIQDLPFVVSPSSSSTSGISTIPWRTKSSSELNRSLRNNSESRSSSPTPSVITKRDGPFIGRRDESRTRTSIIQGGSRSSSPAFSVTQRNSASLSQTGDTKLDRKSGLAGSITERSRAKVIIRQGLIVGSLYMQAGLWPDALRELSEHTNRAKIISDHLWHAKGLENILVVLLLLAWAGADFQIPLVCYTTTEKSTARRQASGGSLTATTKNDESRQKLLEALCHILPDLTQAILDIYARAGNFDGEASPQLVYSEAVIRFSHLLVVLRCGGGLLSREASQYIVLGGKLAVKDIPEAFRESRPTKRSISAMLFKGLPPTLEISGGTLMDTVIILSGMISVLSMADLQRKRAMLIKELLSTLVPGLVQAKKRVAAELGIHPDASLAVQYGPSLINDMYETNSGGIIPSLSEYYGLLNTVCGLYMIGCQDANTPASPCSTKHLQSDAASASVAHIMRESSLRVFGSSNLKSDVLRLCVAFCEALPDNAIAMKYESMLLEIATPGTVPDLSQRSANVKLSREEQMSLASKFQKASNVFASNGHQSLARYWDSFLLRGVRVLESAPANTPTAYPVGRFRNNAQDRSVQMAKTTGPFLHDATHKGSSATIASPVLVVNSLVELVITMQNMFCFEVVIDELTVISDEANFQAEPISCVLGPLRTQDIIISGTLLSKGVLRITGCKASIRGCRTQDFLLFQQPWSPEFDIKLSSYRVGRSPFDNASTLRRHPDTEPQSVIVTKPAPSTTSNLVIAAQPLLIVTHSSLSHPTVMLLDGETRSFSLTVQNTSKSVPIDLVHLSFTTSTPNDPSEEESPSPMVTYDHDQHAKHNPPLRRRKAVDTDADIAPGGTATFEIEINGVMGLADSVVHIDYAHLGEPLADIKDQIYTRRLSVPIHISVKPTVQLDMLRVTPIANAVANPTSQVPTEQAAPQHQYFLLCLDIHNAFHRPLTLSLTDIDLSHAISRSPLTQPASTIPPSHTHRLTLPLPRLRLPFATTTLPIPPLTHAPQKQFLYDPATATDAAAQRRAREAFWYLEALLATLRLEWAEVSSGNGSPRRGTVDLRSALTMTDAMLDIVRADPVAVSLHVIRADGSTRHETDGEELRVGTSVNIRVQLVNRTETPVAPLLRFRPRLGGLDGTATTTSDAAATTTAPQLDITRLVAWSGQLVRCVPLLRQMEEAREEELAMTFLSAGTFDVEVDVVADADADADAVADASAATALMADNQGHARLGGSVVRLHVVD